jgi:hypothetical protein
MHTRYASRHCFPRALFLVVELSRRTLCTEPRHENNVASFASKDMTPDRPAENETTFIDTANIVYQDPASAASDCFQMLNKLIMTVSLL